MNPIWDFGFGIADLGFGIWDLGFSHSISPPITKSPSHQVTLSL